MTLIIKYDIKNKKKCIFIILDSHSHHTKCGKHQSTLKDMNSSFEFQKYVCFIAF